MSESAGGIPKKVTLKATEALIRTLIPYLETKVDAIAKRIDHLESSIRDRFERSERVVRLETLRESHRPSRPHKRVSTAK